MALDLGTIDRARSVSVTALPASASPHLLPGTVRQPARRETVPPAAAAAAAAAASLESRPATDGHLAGKVDESSASDVNELNLRMSFV